MKITTSQLKQIIKEELSKALSREEWFRKLWPDRKNSSIKDLHAEADAARKAGDPDKADAIDDIADHLDIQIDNHPGLWSPWGKWDPEEYPSPPWDEPEGEDQ